MKTLEQVYRDKATECYAVGDTFGYYFWMKRVFEVVRLGARTDSQTARSSQQIWDSFLG